MNDINKSLLAYRFSVFGNFVSIYQKINEFSKIPALSSFKKALIPEVTITGQPVNCYQLNNNEFSLLVRSNRIDFSFKVIQNKDYETFIKYIEIIRDFLPLELIERVAINLNFFVEDQKKENMIKISNGITFLKKFGTPFELNITQNSRFNFRNKIYNNIVSIGHGLIQNKNSFISFNATIYSIDINSAIGLNSKYKFEWPEFKDAFKEMHRRVLIQKDELLKI